MFTTVLAAALALSPGQVPFGPPAVQPPPPPRIPPATIANFIIPSPYGYLPNLYPLVPSPVVMAHPSWYSYPGPAYWYTNNVSPYNPVYHGPVVVVPEPAKKEKR
jgi:hypothetical protein